MAAVLGSDCQNPGEGWYLLHVYAHYVLIRPAQTNIKYLQTKTQHSYRKGSLATQSSRIFIQSTCVHAHDIAKLKVRKQTGWLPLDTKSVKFSQTSPKLVPKSTRKTL